MERPISQSRVHLCSNKSDWTLIKRDGTDKNIENMMQEYTFQIVVGLFEQHFK